MSSEGKVGVIGCPGGMACLSNAVATLRLLQLNTIDLDISTQQDILIHVRMATLKCMGLSVATLTDLEAKARGLSNPVEMLDEYIKILNIVFAPAHGDIVVGLTKLEERPTLQMEINTEPRNRAERRTSPYGRHGGTKGEARPWEKRKGY
jgi:hypothetical protein